MFTRRQLVKYGLLASGHGLTRPGRTLTAQPSLPRSFWDDDVQSPPTTPFVDKMPVPPIAQTVAPFIAPDCEPTALDPQARFYNILEEEALVNLHSELPMTPIWRYRDSNRSKRNQAAAGPTFKFYMNEEPMRSTVGAGPVIARFMNYLPPDHTGFGCPCTTVHYHGGHVEARSDGFPENIEEFPKPIVFSPRGCSTIPCDPPEGIEAFVAGCEQGAPTWYDYCWPIRDVGFSHGEPDPAERACTNWYHDHLFDFTGPNVYRGLAGMVFIFDEYDCDDETGTLFPATNLRFPSGAYDIPLILQDKVLALEDGLAKLVYNAMDHDGYLGDKYLVNGKIQPYFEVARRKYRFRVHNFSNARFYLLFLTRSNGSAVSFTQIGAHGSLINHSVANDRVFIGPAERMDIVVDFSAFQDGDVLYLENFAEQDDGRGPKGKYDDPDFLDEGIKMLKFIVKGGAVADPSQCDFELPAPRRMEPIPQSEINAAKKREFEFDRTNGAWAINGELADLHVSSANPKLNEGEVWRFVNKSGGWWHPVHVHLERMRVLTRDDETPELLERDGFAKEDTVILGPNSEVDCWFKFRDFTGPFVMHCHTLEHEDMRMMARFDVVP